jgi:thiol-disulfide isomerase/thioredoxin
VSGAAVPVSRRVVLGALLAAGCPRSEPELPKWRGWAGYLPRDVAGQVPFEPERLDGQVVLLTFIATWCFPCLAEFAVLSRLDRDYGARGFHNVLVGMDLDGHKTLDPFAQGYELQWPLIVADERLVSGDTPFGRIRELPSRMLFARDGRLVVGFSGVAAYEDLAKLVAAELDRT